jgi:hypothetical protein
MEGLGMTGLKGALISFMPTFVGTAPNVIVFQFNPETITHSWEMPQAESGGVNADGTRTNYDPLAVTGVPGETFSFTLMLDANDEIADIGINPVAGGIATVVGAYARLSALEMLQYPMASASSLLGQVSSTLKNLRGGGVIAPTTVPASQVPVVLFVWGPERIVPVVVSKLDITEKLYDAALNPVQAEVQISLTVLTPDQLRAVEGPMRAIANVAYVYTQGLRQTQAVANLGDAGASILGMLPISV